MKKKSLPISKVLQIKILTTLFFFIFFYNSFSQELSDPFNNLITGNFKTDSITSDSIYLEGVIAQRQEENQFALDLFKKVIFIREKIFNKNHISLAYPYIRMGVAYKNIGRLNEAILSYKEAERIYIINEGQNTYRLGTPYTNLGNVYKQKGNFIDAIKYHQQAINQFYLGDSTSFRSNINNTKYNLAENLFLADRYQESINIIVNCYKNSEYYQKASFLFLLGKIYEELNNNEKANEYFKLSILELENKMVDVIDSTNQAVSYIGYSDFLIKNQQFEEAKYYLMLAKPLIIDSIHGRNISEWYFTFGNLYSNIQFDSNSLEDFRKIKLKNLNEALNYYQKAIIALSTDFTESDPNSNPTILQCKFPANTLQLLQYKAETFYELAKLYTDNINKYQNNMESALSATKIASDLLDNLRTGTVSEESKIVMTQLQNSTYLFSVKVAYELFYLTNDPYFFETAFKNAERNKAASLLDNLTDENARQTSFLPDSLVQKEENINDRITYFTQKLFEENENPEIDTEKIDNYEDQLFQLNHEKNELEHFLEKNFSDYYQLKYADDNISLKLLQRKIAKDEVIIEYVIDSDEAKNKNPELYIFSLSKNDYSFQKSQVDSTFLQNISQVYQFLSGSNYTTIPIKNYLNYLSSAHNLYNTLILPVEEEINDHTITIIPDGILSYIPFDALLYNYPLKIDTLNFINLDYLVKKYTFNYSYSANLYLNHFKTKKRSSKKLLSFAPDYTTHYNFAESEFNKLAPLGGIMDEVESIANYINSDTFTGKDATETNFKKNMADYDILHLAMHAIINDSLPMFSKLAFSPEPGDSALNDGWLYTSEIYNMKLNARLSVLSACNSGSGKLREGEGVISLARGFFYAGCPSIVMTLWEVEDRSGAQIMADFYKFLKAGKKKPEALRLAKLKHLENANPVTSHPHVWLTYVSIGNTKALNTSNDLYFFLAILLILVIIVTDQILRIKKARKNRAW